MNLPETAPDPAVEHEKWMAERDFREREITIEEAQLRIAQEDLALRKQEGLRSRWRNPLAVAIFAAAAAGFGNALVAFLSGYQGQLLENTRAESTRILEMIKTGDPDKAATNLKFLVDAGLIENRERLTAITHFLLARTPGTGPSLPSSTPSGPNSQAYKDGLSARTNWEKWFASLTGDERDGAEYWATQRSSASNNDCSNGRGASSLGFRDGCDKAREKLTPIDEHRAADRDYREGWNKR